MINIGRNNINTDKLSEIDLKSTPLIDRLYTCRDLEISNLWQRSVFLAVFLLLIFTGYGTLLTKSLEKFECLGSYNINSFGLYNLVLLSISSIGCIFSLLWIFMAKGSKAWYEIYGEAISDYERCFPTEVSEIFGMGKNYHPSDKSNNNIFSTSGGAYSVSKVNILIGIVSFIIWILLSCAHLLLTIFYLIDKNSLYEQLTTNSNIWVIISLFGIILFTTIVVTVIYKQSNSSFLGFNEYKPLLDKDGFQAEAKDCLKLAKIIKKIEIDKKEEDRLLEIVKENISKFEPQSKRKTRYQYVIDEVNDYIEDSKKE